MPTPSAPAPSRPSGPARPGPASVRKAAAQAIGPNRSIGVSPRSTDLGHDAVADERDGAPLGRLGPGEFLVRQGAKGELQGAELAREGEDLGLPGRYFERRRAADDGPFAVLLAERLVDGQNLHAAQDGLALERLAAFALVPPGQDHVDLVARQNEAAGAGFGRNLGRDGAHPGGQDGRHDAALAGGDELLLLDRLAADECGPDDGAL